MCVCRCWCPDRTLAQARKYIADVMGRRYAEGVILDLEAMWGESTPRTPLVCFLSMGSDPTNNIEGLAKKLHLDCHSISMGQGQEVHARRLLHQSMTTVSHIPSTLLLTVTHSTCAGDLGSAPELPPRAGLYGRAAGDCTGDRECSLCLSSLDHH